MNAERQQIVVLLLNFDRKPARDFYNKRSVVISVNLWLSNYRDISKCIESQENQ